ncbi:type II toxin-antitoxin system RelE/ParE family toxin [Flavobacterium sp. N1736]|uniref:type II toxin-antitoxin system RelE/ParE family toxin n=1 Tax=Flavobacterium sp. N1736 TaxID=2986823 RepID=UPI0039B696AC
MFNYYKEKSIQGAHNFKNDILEVTAKIQFNEQYQKDEIESEYRRIIVRNYKILYREEDLIIYIIKIISVKRDSRTQL